MERSELRRKHGSIKEQAFLQGFKDPALASIHTVSKGIRKFAHATKALKNSRSIDSSSSDLGVSGGDSSRNEPMPTSLVSSGKNHLLVEENLSTAPVPDMNPRFIAPIPEEPPLEKLEDDDLQNAVVYQNSKLFEKTKGQWVAELLSE